MILNTIVQVTRENLHVPDLYYPHGLRLEPPLLGQNRTQTVCAALPHQWWNSGLCRASTGRNHHQLLVVTQVGWVSDMNTETDSEALRGPNCEWDSRCFQERSAIKVELRRRPRRRPIRWCGNRLKTRAHLITQCDIQPGDCCFGGPHLHSILTGALAFYYIYIFGQSGISAGSMRDRPQQ